MICGFKEELLSGFYDRELDAAQTDLVAGHLKLCAECAASIESMADLTRRARGLHFESPAYLEGRVRSALRSELRAPPSERNYYWLAALAAALVLAAGLLWIGVGLVHRNSTQTQIADAVVSSHIRSLLATHLLDVPSTDRHTVKPWFDGKLDFSPDVKDLTADGFPLTGGRLDYLDGRQVAALIFHRRLHVINLFLWPSADAASNPTAVASRNGYNVVHWSTGAMTFWAVADVPENELIHFGQLYKTRE